jgi:hypothetical protein
VLIRHPMKFNPASVLSSDSMRCAWLLLLLLLPQAWGMVVYLHSVLGCLNSSFKCLFK